MNEDRYQLGNILVQERYKNCLKNARACPRAVNDSNHHLIVAEIRLKLERVIKEKAVQKFDLEQINVRSKEKELQEKYIMEKKRTEKKHGGERR